MWLFHVTLLWLVPGIPEHVHPLTALWCQFSHLDDEVDASPLVITRKVSREIALNFNACMEHRAHSCCLLGLRKEFRQMTNGLWWCFPSQHFIASEPDFLGDIHLCLLAESYMVPNF